MNRQNLRKRAKRYLTSVKGLILTAGALAAAILSVLSLLHKSNPTPLPKNNELPRKVTFSDTHANGEMSLEEYEERVKNRPVGVLRPLTPAPARLPGSAYRLAADVSPTSTSVSGSSPTAGTSEVKASTTPPGTVSDTKSPTTTFATPPPSHAPTKEVDGVRITEATGASQSSVAATIAELPVPQSRPGPKASPPPTGSSPVIPPQGITIALPTKCSHTGCGATTTIENVMLSHRDPRAAARELVSVFTHSRNERIGAKLYPIGVDVRYTVDVVGYKGQKVIVEFSLWPDSRHRHLPKPWLRELIDKQYEIKEEDQPVSSSFWVPEPSLQGAYSVLLTAYDTKGKVLQVAETNVFH